MNAQTKPPVVLYGLEYVTLVNAFHHQNDTGELRSFGFGQALPEAMPAIRNSYFLYNITGTRGHHAHLYVHQVLCAVAGSFDIHLDDGMGNERTYRLDNPLTGLYVPPMTWRVLDGFTPDGMCHVLSSHAYDEEEYLRDHAAFKEKVWELRQ